MNSVGLGISRPLVVPHAAIEMKQRGRNPQWIDQVVYLIRSRHRKQSSISATSRFPQA